MAGPNRAINKMAIIFGDTPFNGHVHAAETNGCKKTLVIWLEFCKISLFANVCENVLF